MIYAHGLMKAINSIDSKFIVFIFLFYFDSDISPAHECYLKPGYRDADPFPPRPDPQPGSWITHIYRNIVLKNNTRNKHNLSTIKNALQKWSE